MAAWAWGGGTGEGPWQPEHTRGGTGDGMRGGMRGGPMAAWA